ncbi:MAG: putative toxin-antitoxin system toxin component, PIN family, partial [Candidatus Marinimicrobia bacterium]|nr:putative toxin-antitoxin system toxin component, PIN family [Candidatus Neomarinimicrobiota bacterium]
MRVKCVVDTNVLISAALSKGVPFRIVEHLIKNNALIFSKETISELSSRITQPKFDKYVSADDREAYVNNLILSADLVIIDNLIQGCRDRDDDKFLETAVKGDAQFIIS